MDSVAFHREPPSHLPTMVVAFGGWIDAGEAVTGAMRHLVRHLPAIASRLNRLRGILRFYQGPTGRAPDRRWTSVIRWPRSEFFAWQPSESHAGLLLFRGMEPHRMWRTYTTLLLDVAEQCGVQRIVSLGALLAAAPYPATTRHGQQHRPRMASAVRGVGNISSTELRRPDRHCHRPLGRGDATRHAYLTLMGQAPHYLQGSTNPAVSRALLIYVIRLLGLELDLSPFDEAVQAFCTRCDQAVAHDASIQAYVRQLEQDYDATVDEAPRPLRDDDFNPEKLMQELEDFLREQREGGAE